MPPQRTTPSTSKTPPAKKAWAPKPPRPAEQRLPKLYKGLTDQINDGHFANAKKTCNKILNLDASSTAAFQTLLFLHLDTDDYASALSLLDTPPTASPLDFERAYCLYRLHREREALEILLKLGKAGRKERHLEAQIRYRLGEYNMAQEIYDELLAGCDSSSTEHPDIIENLQATSAHLDFDASGYNSYLHVPPPADIGSASLTRAPVHVPTDADLETYVPSLPTGWATGGLESVKKAAAAPKAQMAKAVKKEEPKTKRRKHKLPQGATDAKPFTGDVDRWLPVKQRASYIAAMSKKKGQNLSMGTGMTQGSTTQAANAVGGGGGKKKKGKK